MSAIIYQQIPIRLQLSTASAPPVAPLDANTGNTPAFWRGQAISVQVGIFDAMQNPVDISNLQSISLAILPSVDSIIPSAVSTVAAADFDNTSVTWQEWISQATQQVSFDLTPLLTDLALGGAPNLPYWLVVSGVTAGGQVFTYGAGPIIVWNPGAQIPFPVGGFTSWHAQSNSSSAGSTVVAPTSPIHTEEVSFTGSAGIRPVVVQTVGAQAGARCDIICEFPKGTAGIDIKIYNGTLSGALLAEFYSPGDGVTGNAIAGLSFDGAAWQPRLVQQPAFPS